MPVFSYAKIYPEDITYSLSPQNPAPNSTVLISIQTYSTDLNQDKITWSSGGKTIKSGIAEKTASIKLGNVGTVTIVNIDITEPDGTSVRKTISLSPTIIDLVWQANSYTPPFYKGKGLYVDQGEAQIIALPIFMDTNGKKINPSELIYKWTQNGKVLGSLSGYGKQTLSVTGSVISRPLVIEVDINTLDGKITGHKEITLNPTTPKLVFYKNSPLYGVIYEKALNVSTELMDKELTITAVPYFFSTTIKNGVFIGFSWTMNGQSIGGNGDTQTFRVPENTTGTSIVSLKVENFLKVLQFANRSLSLSYNSQ